MGQNGDYYGYVKSSDPADCESGRKVTVYKQLGSVQDPKTDQKIGSDTAELNGTEGDVVDRQLRLQERQLLREGRQGPRLLQGRYSKTISR